MIKEFKKTIAYICPYCSSINMKEVNLFDFSGKNATIFPCKDKACCDECVSISPKKDKYAISITCPVCDDVHTFNMRKITFWQNKFFALRCPDASIGIFFAGDAEKVKSEVEQQEKMFEQLQDECTIGDDLNTIFEIVERINDLAKDGNVTCTCGSTSISIEIDNEKITLRCKSCQKTKEIPATEASLNELLNTSAIVLD